MFFGLFVNSIELPTAVQKSAEIIRTEKITAAVVILILLLLVLLIRNISKLKK